MNELQHHGVKGMKWGVRKKRVSNVISNNIKKKLKSNSERFKDQLASRDPISKSNREQAKERSKNREEMNEIKQAKGKAKVAKILEKIGKDLLHPRVVDGPSDLNRGGRI